MVGPACNRRAGLGGAGTAARPLTLRGTGSCARREPSDPCPNTEGRGGAAEPGGAPVGFQELHTPSRPGLRVAPTRWSGGGWRAEGLACARIRLAAVPHGRFYYYYYYYYYYY